MSSPWIFRERMSFGLSNSNTHTVLRPPFLCREAHWLYLGDELKVALTTSSAADHE